MGGEGSMSLASYLLKMNKRENKHSFKKTDGYQYKDGEKFVLTTGSAYQRLQAKQRLKRIKSRERQRWVCFLAIIISFALVYYYFASNPEVLAFVKPSPTT